MQTADDEWLILFCKIVRCYVFHIYCMKVVLFSYHVDYLTKLFVVKQSNRLGVFFKRWMVWDFFLNLSLLVCLFLSFYLFGINKILFQMYTLMSLTPPPPHKIKLSPPLYQTINLMFTTHPHTYTSNIHSINWYHPIYLQLEVLFGYHKFTIVPHFNYSTETASFRLSCC